MKGQLSIGLLDGQITDVTSEWMASAELASHFPIGEVYTLSNEPQGLQWRNLQRGIREIGRQPFFDMLLPINADQVPEIVRMAVLMRD